MKRTLDYPFTLAKVKELKVGDRVCLSGRVLTGRDRFHKFAFEDGKCPVDLKDGALYHCGPVVIGREGKWVVQAAGPTTSSRQDLYMPRIIERCHLRVIIGKGGMGPDTLRACAKYGCVYLQAVGGAAGVLAQKIAKVNGVYFLEEFGAADAVWDLEVKDFTAVVTMDTRGTSYHRRILNTSKRALRNLMGGPAGRKR